VTGARRGALCDATRVQHHSRRHLSNIGLHRFRVRGVPGSRHLGRGGCRQRYSLLPAIYTRLPPQPIVSPGRPGGLEPITRQG
jgi:hypothetical protein